MKAEDYKSFSALLKALAEYCGRALHPDVVSIYWHGLLDLDLDAVRQALNAHLQNPDTGQFMPKIADIRRMLGGTTRDAALLAWNKVTEAVGRVGAYRSVCFDDPIVNRTIQDMGGWPALCAKPTAEMPFVEKNFCDRYRAYRTVGGTPGHPPYLIGIAEAQNAQVGFCAEPPMLVGHAGAARLVMEAGSTLPLIAVTAGEFAGNSALARLGRRHGVERG